MRQARAAFGRAHPEARRPKASDEVPCPDLLDAEFAEPGVQLGGNVVVIEVEAPLGDARLPRDGMEFVERGVAHEMTPDSPVTRP